MKKKKETDGMNRAIEIATARAAHTGQAYYIIRLAKQYISVCCRDYYLKFFRHEAIRRIEIA